MRAWPLAMIVLIGLVLWADKTGLWHATDTAREIPVVCATLATGCAVQVEGHEIHFGMQGELKPLAPFDIWVATSATPALGKAEARFTMEGMDMGFNLYTLRPDAKGVLRAKVTLPICVTGRRDWNMILEIDKSRLIIPFVTNL